MEKRSLLDANSIANSKNIRARKYWDQRLKESTIVNYFNVGKCPKTFVSNESSDLQLEISKLTYKNLEALAESKQAKHIVLLGILGVLANKYALLDDVIIYTPTIRPSQDNAEGKAILPIRISNFKGGNFKQLLNSLKRNFIEDVGYDYYPVLKTFIDDNKIIEKVPTIGISLDGSIDNAQWELLSPDILFCFDFNKTTNFGIHYNPHVYAQEGIEILGKYFTNLLDILTVNLLDPITEINVLKEKETGDLINMFKGSEVLYEDETILNLFAKQLKNKPNATAIFFEDATLTYQELDESSNKLANYLIDAYDLNTSDTVGIFMDRNSYLIVSILAVLKCGCAYVPVDPDFPKDRIAMIFSDSNCRLLISEMYYISSMDCFNGPKFVIDIEFDGMNSSNEAVDRKISKDELAYIIYTSGTTGKPKGVRIKHASLLNYVSWAASHYVDEEPANFALFTSIAFDLTLTSIFIPIATGNSIVVYGKADPFDLLQKICMDSRVQVLKLTPSHLRSLGNIVKEKEQLYINKFIVGGERLEQSLANTISNIFENNVSIYNEYGPTEATIGCMVYEHRDVDTDFTVPIGRPITNTQLFVLDADLKPVLKGVSGELYISGVGISEGYQGNILLTKERFIENPFKEGDKIYKTGDIVRCLPNGNIEYLGRNDDQVKIRGYRVELGEITSRLESFPEIKQALVVVREISGEDKQLVGYIVTTSSVTKGSIRDFLLNDLPDYMVPNYYITLDEFPLTSNGKIDHQALPELNFKSEINHIAPTGEREKIVTKIWSEALRVNESDISVLQDFFELGGSSLSAFQIVLKIKSELSITLQIGDVFTYKTIRDLTAYLESCAEEEIEEVISKAPEKERYLTSAAQERMFYQYLIDKNNLTYNIAGGLIIEGIINKIELKGVLNKIVKRHPSLRTNFVNEKDGVFQKINNYNAISFESYRSIDIEINQAFKKFIQPHDLENGLPIRFGIYEINESKNVLFVDVHHIACDGYSLRTLINDLKRLLKKEQLPVLPVNYVDYSYWQRTKKNNIEKQKSYWQNRLSGELPIISLSTTYEADANISTAKSEPLVLTKEDHTAVRKFIRRNEVTNFSFFISIYYLLLHKISGDTDIIIGSDVIGRTHSDLKNVVGTFINVLPLRLTVNSEISYDSFLKEVQKCTLEAFENQDFQFDDMVKIVDLTTTTDRPPIVQVHFAFDDLEEIDKGFEAGSLKFTPAALNNAKTTQYEFKLDASANSDSYVINFVYSEHWYEEETINVFKKYYKNIIDIILADKGIKIGDIQLT